MAGIPLEHGLLLAATLFAIGFAGLLVRRNIMSVSYTHLTLPTKRIV